MHQSIKIQRNSNLSAMQIESKSSFKGSGYGTEEEENTEKNRFFRGEFQ
jgi:hypothetical protein